MSVFTLLDKLNFQEFKKRLKSLDASLSDLVSGEPGGDLIEKIALRYDFDAKNTPGMIILFGLYITRLVTNQEFIDYLAVFVPPKYFSQFLRELEDKLWSPYDVYLNKAGVVYKQLTKLTPTPVVEEPTQQPVTQLPITVELPKIPEVPKVAEMPKVSEIPKIPEPPVTSSKPASTQGFGVAKPVIISDIAPAGEKTVPEARSSVVSRESLVNTEARVKFDAPRVGPRIFKSTESAITPKASEVKFVGPEIKPEVSANVPPASSQWQRPEEKIVEIPKPPEVKKTEVAGRQVIDLTNFGLSKPDEE